MTKLRVVTCSRSGYWDGERGRLRGLRVPPPVDDVVVTSRYGLGWGTRFLFQV